jgi:hypothetical protein
MPDPDDETPSIQITPMAAGRRSQRPSAAGHPQRRSRQATRSRLSKGMRATLPLRRGPLALPGGHQRSNDLRHGTRSEQGALRSELLHDLVGVNRW